MQDHPHIERSMFVVPYRIFQLPGLTISFLRFYETIFQFWNSQGKLPCFLSNKKIMERTGISSISTIQEAFGFFESHGEMERRTVNGRRYLVQPERKIEIIEQDPPIDLAIPPYRFSDTPPIDLAIHKKANIKKANIKKDIKSIREAEAPRQKIEQSRFEDFWNAYPESRRKIKWKTKEIWIRKKLDDLADIIIADIKNRVLNEADWEEEKFIPHSHRYLRDSRWEDEITLRRPKSKKLSQGEMVLNLFSKESSTEGDILNGQI